MRQPVMAANWKMNKTSKEALEFVKEFKSGLSKGNKNNAEIVICASFTSLPCLQLELKGSGIGLGGQNIFYEKEGAYTGEVSALMIKEFCEYVILGHSERRHALGEKNEIVSKKTRTALAEDLKVIFCVGETLNERESNITWKIIEEQLRKGFNGIDKEQALNIIIAYEPVWAIGTGKTATPKQAEEAHSFIRKLIAEIFDEDYSEKTRILYGGSVKPENVKELMSQPNIDGALVGGASMNPESFLRIVNY